MSCLAVIAGVINSADLIASETINAANGEPISVTVTDDGIYLNDTARVLLADVETDNGVIHVIDSVLFVPEDMGMGGVEDEAAADTGDEAAADTGDEAAADTGDEAAADTGDEAAADTGDEAAAEAGDEAAADAGDEAAADTGDEATADAGDEAAAEAGDEAAADTGDEAAADTGDEAAAEAGDEAAADTGDEAAAEAGEEAAAATASNEPVTHVVQRGETLSGIADDYGVSWQAIAQANHIKNPNKIYAGQTLIIPVGQPDIQAKHMVRRVKHCSAFRCNTMA